MEHADHSKLQRLADYRNARRTLGVAGTWSVLFGAMSIAAGCLWSPVDWVLTVLGAGLLASGLWNMQAPRPAGIAADAGILLLVGAYNLIAAVFAALDGLPPSPLRPYLGAFQLVWGIRRIGNLRQFAEAFLGRPSEAETREIEQTLWAIRRALARGTPDVIEFAVGARGQAWKARFEGENGVFVELEGPGLFVGSRLTVTITPRAGNKPDDAQGPARVRPGDADLSIGTARLRITIAPEAMRAYEHWKAGPGLPRPVAA